MAAVNNTAYVPSAYYTPGQYETGGTKKNETSAGVTGKAKGTTGPGSWVPAGEKTTEVTGPRTYGNPQLSEEGRAYYESLVSKYGNMNFVLVSADKKNEAEMMKGSFANASKMTVLIDTDKIERMARDENYRARYENIIANAQKTLQNMSNSIGSSGAGIRAFGMSVNHDGRASFFAVMNKSMTSMSERLAEKRAEKIKQRKADEKKAKKEEAAERGKHTEHGKHVESGKHVEDGKHGENGKHVEGGRHGESGRHVEGGRYGESDRYAEDGTVTVKADSMEALMNKIQDYYQHESFSQARTAAEKMVGSQINYGA